MNSTRTVRVVRGVALVLLFIYCVGAFAYYFSVPAYEAMNKLEKSASFNNLLAAVCLTKALGAVFLRICRLQLALFVFFVAGTAFSIGVFAQGGKVVPSLTFFFEFLVLGFFMFIWSRQARKSAD